MTGGERQPREGPKAPLLTVHTREVCEDCNTGWMSALEETAKPVILQMERLEET